MGDKHASENSERSLGFPRVRKKKMKRKRILFTVSNLLLLHWLLQAASAEGKPDSEPEGDPEPEGNPETDPDAARRVLVLPYASQDHQLIVSPNHHIQQHQTIPRNYVIKRPRIVYQKPVETKPAYKVVQAPPQVKYHHPHVVPHYEVPKYEVIQPHYEVVHEPKYEPIKPTYEAIKPTYEAIKPTYEAIKPTYEVIQPHTQPVFHHQDQIIGNQPEHLVPIQEPRAGRLLDNVGNSNSAQPLVRDQQTVDPAIPGFLPDDFIIPPDAEETIPQIIAQPQQQQPQPVFLSSGEILDFAQLPQHHHLQPHRIKPLHHPHPHPQHRPVPVYDYGHPDPRHKYKQSSHSHYQGPPDCAKDQDITYCVDDYQYPKYEIEEALLAHYDAVREMYKDAFLETYNSVDDLEELEEETYLCPSKTAYIRPLRAVSARGKWRVIVNKVKLYRDTLTQSARVEECLTAGELCPITPDPYGSKCRQKAIYHRFLIYDPYAYDLSSPSSPSGSPMPFSVDVFKLPSSCACHSPQYSLPEPRTKDKKKRRKKKESEAVYRASYTRTEL